MQVDDAASRLLIGGLEIGDGDLAPTDKSEIRNGQATIVNLQSSICNETPPAYARDAKDGAGKRTAAGHAVHEDHLTGSIDGRRGQAKRPGKGIGVTKTNDRRNPPGSAAENRGNTGRGA
jgi:hypothetical protein